MWRKKIWAPLCLVFGGVAALGLITLEIGEMGKPVRAGEADLTVTGTGTLEVTGDVQLPIIPDIPCAAGNTSENIQVLERHFVEGSTITAAGLIEASEGDRSIKVIRWRCVTPFLTTVMGTTTLLDAEIEGRRGDLVLEQRGTSFGNITVGDGVVTSYPNFTIRGVSGQLAGARGEGILMTQARNFTDPSLNKSSSVYYLEIRLPGGK